MKTKKIKILLVDDDEMIRIYFRDIFWIHGTDNKYDLAVVDDVKKAEKIIESPETRPDIIFLDLVMPIEINGKITASPEAGFDLLKKIKSSDELKNIKIVVFSGHSEKTLQDSAKKLGAEEYLIKGNNLPKELIDYVEQLTANQ